MSDDEIAARTRAAIMAVWQTNKPIYLARAAAIAQAAEAAAGDGLDAEAREAAASEAHKVAGAVGTFGFHEASRIAKQIEKLLDGDAPIEADRFRALAADLSRSLEP